LLDLDRHRHLGHADPERNQFQANEKVDELYFFPENSNILSKILKNDDTFDTKEKENASKLRFGSGSAPKILVPIHNTSYNYDLVP
jgi:hypothetical protein